MEFIYKENWQDARRHWVAFWEGEIIDRPCLMIRAPKYPEAKYRLKDCPFPTRKEYVVPEPEDPFTKWTNINYQIEHQEAVCRSTHYLGESIPFPVVQMAWCAYYGGPLQYGSDTIWPMPFIESWSKAPDWSKDWDDWGWRHLKKATQAMVEAAAEKYFVGTPPFFYAGPSDMLSAMRGPSRFLMDLVEHPEAIKHASKMIRRTYLKMYDELQEIRSKEGEGYCSWLEAWSGKRMAAFQSDVSCMISPKMFEEFIIPELEELSGAMDCSFYHLDGPEALKHVDMICELPKVTVIQWVPGVGQPIGAYWMDLYKKIQAKGKGLYIHVPKGELETIIRELNPRRLLLKMEARDMAEAKRIFKKAAFWTARYHGKNL